MKSIKSVIIFLCFSIMASGAATAATDFRSKHGPVTRILIAQGRGVTNIFTFLGELGRTLPSEIKKHKRLWPATYPLRAANNMFMRFSSGVNDVLVVPFVAPFTDDIRPMTEHLGLPTYAWQNDEEKF